MQRNVRVRVSVVLTAATCVFATSCDDDERPTARSAETTTPSSSPAVASPTAAPTAPTGSPGVAIGDAVVTAGFPAIRMVAHAGGYMQLTTADSRLVMSRSTDGMAWEQVATDLALAEVRFAASDGPLLFIAGWGDDATRRRRRRCQPTTDRPGHRLR